VNATVRLKVDLSLMWNPLFHFYQLRVPSGTELQELPPPKKSWRFQGASAICLSDMQSPRTKADYIRNLIAQGHESVLEHVSWTFLLEG